MYNKLLGVMIGGSIILIIILLALVIIYLIGLWKLFKKADKNGWEAIIPFYNTYVLVEISGLNWWYFLIAISGTICSFLNIDGLYYLTNMASLVVMFFCFYNIAKKMKQSPIGFAIVGALFQMILVPIIGLSSKYTFDNSISVSLNGPIGDTKDNVPEKYCLNCGQKLSDNNVKYCPNCGKEIK